jgi:uncharacterized protein HemY
MDRTQLLAQVSTASSPNDISTAIAGVRTWLSEHPEDDELRRALQQLTRLDRNHWSRAAG